METWSLGDLIREVCKRPRMIAISGAFVEIAAYINGFSAGRGAEFYNELTNFNNWLGIYCYRNYGLPRNYIWNWYIENELVIINNDPFKTLMLYFEKYRIAMDNGEVVSYPE